MHFIGSSIIERDDSPPCAMNCTFRNSPDEKENLLVSQLELSFKNNDIYQDMPKTLIPAMLNKVFSAVHQRELARYTKMN